jgi:hypothetical protein
MPVSSGAFERAMYARMSGAKYPPAPATTACWNGMRTVSAHIAFASDCFSYVTTRTRRWMPPVIRLDPTMPVEPPTLPAVCTRSTGFPDAANASARYSSGIMVPSNMSGALPTTIASMSFQPTSASFMARSTASRRRPFSDTSTRIVSCFVCPIPTTAQRWLIGPPRARRRGSAAGTGRTSHAPPRAARRPP